MEASFKFVALSILVGLMSVAQAAQADEKFQGFYSVLETGISEVDITRFNGEKVSFDDSHGKMAAFSGLKVGHRWQIKSFQIGLFGQLSKTASKVNYSRIGYKPARELGLGISLGYVFGAQKNMQIFFEGSALSFVKGRGTAMVDGTRVEGNYFRGDGFGSLGFEHLLGENWGYRISTSVVYHKSFSNSTRFQDTRFSAGAVYRF